MILPSLLLAATLVPDPPPRLPELAVINGQHTYNEMLYGVMFQRYKNRRMDHITYMEWTTGRFYSNWILKLLQDIRRSDCPAKTRREAIYDLLELVGPERYWKGDW